MKIAAGWLDDAPLQGFCAALEAAGHQALFVGGCVRNTLLRAPVADLDLATDALPQTVSDVAEKAGLRVVPTGLAHGTVTVVSGGTGWEVTTFRRDVATDGRHATVAFTGSLIEDARRRDFTMNALYADRRGAVLDPLGGLADLQARRVRFVGDPEARIREDFLRILRFFRFFAQYGDPRQGLDAEGLAACAGLAEGIAGLSKERIGAEMRKLLGAPDPAPAVAAMAQAGVLAHVLPGSDARWLPVLVHLEGGAPVRWLRRLAVLGGEEATENLRLSRAESVSLRALRASLQTPDPAELGYRLGAAAATDAVLIAAALSETPPQAVWQEEIARGASAEFPLRAADFPDLGGAELGERLRATEARWIASGFRLTRAELLD